jgi:hypothetical protein
VVCSAGTFDTAEEAALCYDAACRELRGPSTTIKNFPDIDDATAAAYRLKAREALRKGGAVISAAEPGEQDYEPPPRGKGGSSDAAYWRQQQQWQQQPQGGFMYGSNTGADALAQAAAAMAVLEEATAAATATAAEGGVLMDAAAAAAAPVSAAVAAAQQQQQKQSAGQKEEGSATKYSEQTLKMLGDELQMLQDLIADTGDVAGAPATAAAADPPPAAAAAVAVSSPAAAAVAAPSDTPAAAATTVEDLGAELQLLQDLIAEAGGDTVAAEPAAAVAAERSPAPPAAGAAGAVNDFGLGLAPTSGPGLPPQPTAAEAAEAEAVATDKLLEAAVGPAPIDAAARSDQGHLFCSEAAH